MIRMCSCCSFGTLVFNFHHGPPPSLSLSVPPLSLALVKMLIMEVDVKLYNFFESSECSDYLFCHRYVYYPCVLYGNQDLNI